jgi:hypothetical protein
MIVKGELQGGISRRGRGKGEGTGGVKKMGTHLYICEGSK